MLENTGKVNINQLTTPERRPRPESEQRYEALRKTLLWDPERKQWNWSMGENQKLGSSIRHSYDQLLGVLTEFQFNPDLAKQRYEVLKQTSLWDPEKEQWNDYTDENQQLVHSNRYTDAQLLGILVEHLFEKPESLEPNIPELPEKRAY